MKSPFLKKFVLKILLKSHIEHAHKVHFTVSDEFEETLLATGIHRSKINAVIFPLCFDLSKFEMKPNKVLTNTKKVTLSFIGRITPKKRIDLVINALEIMPTKLKNKIKFNVFGPDEECLWDHKKYNERHIGVEINYFGTVYDDELFNAYKETDIFILCSESENFAISVVEAAYCYCVPLITAEVGVGRYFSDASACIAKLDAKDISSKIQDLLIDQGKRQKLSANARIVSEQFSMKNLERDYFLKLIG
jgi:glycosyltransferase involved in cell wall biosynthesis